MGRVWVTYEASAKKCAGNSELFLFITTIFHFMNRIKNIQLAGAVDKPILLDIFFEACTVKRPVVIYAHGFNGFKDWGNFDLIADQFVVAGFVFVKFNFSHNGTTPAAPEDFVDTEAFGNNNYTIQLEDLQCVTNWLCNSENEYGQVVDTEKIYLIGHSMGGGISILFTAEDERIKKLVTWAAISECKTPWGNWSQDKMAEWKERGVQYYANSRTKQELPLYYQLYKNYVENKERLDIKRAMQTVTVPVLICHGTSDPAVPLQSALNLKSWQAEARLFTLDTDHVFGRRHPNTEAGLPEAMQLVIDASIAFLQNS